MTTKRERILAAIKTNLAGTVGVGTRIFRSRVEAFTRSETPAIVIEPISDTPQDSQNFFDKINYELKIRVSVIVRGSTPDSIADPTIESLHTKILNDVTLGGLSFDIKPSTTSFEILEADEPAGVISCEFDIEYRTGYNSLTT
tara:strand:- start:1100 stop:1528 length:429 start_codon:yes stop_codon:yes gene_type:complete